MDMPMKKQRTLASHAAARGPLPLTLHRNWYPPEMEISGIVDSSVEALSLA